MREPRAYLYKLDEHNNPVPFPETNEGLHAWAEWFETANRVIRRTQMGRVTIVTAFLALDPMAGFGDEPPLLWGTVILERSRSGRGGMVRTRGTEEVCRDTLELALEDHKSMIRWVRRNRKQLRRRAKQEARTRQR